VSNICVIFIKIAEKIIKDNLEREKDTYMWFTKKVGYDFQIFDVFRKIFSANFFRPRFFPDSQLRGKGNNFEDAKKFSLSNLGQVSIDPFEDKNKGLFTRSTKRVLNVFKFKFWREAKS
jgi:hypothetical protein